MIKIIIISGPNLNARFKNYGLLTYNELNFLIINRYPEVLFSFYQSNHEGDIIDKLQTLTEYDALIINAAGYTYLSCYKRCFGVGYNSKD